MKRLLRAMWHLGPRFGYRYWKIENECIKDPSLVLRWASRCRLEAGRCRPSNTLAAITLWKWADELEKTYAAHIKHKS